MDFSKKKVDVSLGDLTGAAVLDKCVIFVAPVN